MRFRAVVKHKEEIIAIFESDDYASLLHMVFGEIKDIDPDLSVNFKISIIKQGL